jgi:uncharacterized membrane protein YfcA
MEGDVMPISPNELSLIVLGACAGGCAGLLAGLLGIGGGVVIVPVVFYGLVASHMAPDLAAHVAVSTSLAAILPAALVSSFTHWRGGNADIDFLRKWGPGIVFGVVAGQLAAPHLRGSMLTGVFAMVCVLFAVRFIFPGRFRPLRQTPPEGWLRQALSAGIGLSSGLAGVGGGIVTNVVMNLSGVTMHKSVGRAAVAGVVVSIPATIVAGFGPGSHGATQLGTIDLAVWACIAPTQAIAAWIGARLARHIDGPQLSRVFGVALVVTGTAMLRSVVLSA